MAILLTAVNLLSTTDPGWILAQQAKGIESVGSYLQSQSVISRALICCTSDVLIHLRPCKATSTRKAECGFFVSDHKSTARILFDHAVSMKSLPSGSHLAPVALQNECPDARHIPVSEVHTFCSEGNDPRRAKQSPRRVPPSLVRQLTPVPEGATPMVVLLGARVVVVIGGKGPWLLLVAKDVEVPSTVVVPSKLSSTEGKGPWDTKAPWISPSYMGWSLSTIAVTVGPTLVEVDVEGAEFFVLVVSSFTSPLPPSVGGKTPGGVMSSGGTPMTPWYKVSRQFRHQYLDSVGEWSLAM